MKGDVIQMKSFYETQQQPRLHSIKSNHLMATLFKHVFIFSQQMAAHIKNSSTDGENLQEVGTSHDTSSTLSTAMNYVYK